MSRYTVGTRMTWICGTRSWKRWKSTRAASWEHTTYRRFGQTKRSANLTKSSMARHRFRKYSNQIKYWPSKNSAKRKGRRKRQKRRRQCRFLSKQKRRRKLRKWRSSNNLQPKKSTLVRSYKTSSLGRKSWREWQMGVASCTTETRIAPRPTLRDMWKNWRPPIRRLYRSLQREPGMLWGLRRNKWWQEQAGLWLIRTKSFCTPSRMRHAAY